MCTMFIMLFACTSVMCTPLSTHEWYVHITLMTVSTENSTSPKSTKLKNSDSLVSHCTNSSWDFGLCWMCTEEFEFLDLADFGGGSIFHGNCNTHHVCSRGHSASVHKMYIMSFVGTSWMCAYRITRYACSRQACSSVMCIRCIQSYFFHKYIALAHTSQHDIQLGANFHEGNWPTLSTLYIQHHNAL